MRIILYHQYVMNAQKEIEMYICKIAYSKMNLVNCFYNLKIQRFSGIVMSENNSKKEPNYFMLRVLFFCQKYRNNNVEKA